MLLTSFPEESVQLLEEGVELAKRVGDRNSLAIFYSRMGRYYSIKEGKPLRGIEYSEKALLEGEKIHDVDLVIRAGSDLMPSYSLLGQSLKVVDLAKKIIDLLEKEKREKEFMGLGLAAYSLAHGYYVWSMGFLGRFDKGVAYLDRGFRFATANDKLGLGWIEFTYGWHLNMKGQAKKAIDHLRKAVVILENAKMYVILPPTYYQLGWAHIMTGELETARGHLERGFKIQRDAGTSFWLSIYHLLQGMLHFDAGDFKSAQDSMEEAVRLAQNNNEGQVTGYSKIWLGRISNKSDPSKRGRSEQLILQGIEILRKLSIKPWWSQGYLFFAEINRDSGNKEKAMENLKKAETMFKEMEMDYWVARTQKVLGRL
jgi:tetratricopeptide (TPR) repeat protein